MPVIAVNHGEEPDAAALACALAGLAPGAPVVVMTHGFRYSPACEERSPHRHILEPFPGRHRRGTPSWPARLGLRAGGGLGIAYGWEARGTFWRAHAAAAAAGDGLARLLDHLQDAGAGRPVHLVAHSLGARTALRAIAAAPAGAVGRAILLAPAASRGEARAALLARPRTEVVSVTARANRAFDALYRAALPHHGPTVGAGIGTRLPNWLDLALDDAATAGHLAELGWPVRPGRHAVCHWSSYLRPGVWPLYRALLDAERTPLELLRAPLAPAAPRVLLRRTRVPGGHRHARAHPAPLLAHAQRPQDHHCA